MLGKRIIPCLDVKLGRVVKGINFEGLRDVGDPVEIAKFYDREGADEITFLDITATNDGRKTLLDVVERTAREIFVPLTVGGGIRHEDEIRDILLAGADKVSINSAAVTVPGLVGRAAERYGSQCIVVAIDSMRVDGEFHVMINAGTKDTGIDAVKWAQEMERQGAGEILLTSKDADGTKAGYDIEITRLIAESVGIPVIASGGCGKLEDFSEAFLKTGADAALAASVLHFRELTISEIKEHLAKNNVPVRLGGKREW